jgi:RimJ/RimL family protein N-acetyltransferase
MSHAGWECHVTGHVLTTAQLKLLRLEPEHEQPWIRSFDPVDLGTQEFEDVDRSAQFDAALRADRGWEEWRRPRPLDERGRVKRGPQRVFYVESWATIDALSGAFVGYSVLQQLHEFTVRIAGWMAPEHRGLQRLSERAAVLTAMAHHHLGFRTVVASFFASDSLSIEAYKSAGYDDADGKLPPGAPHDASVVLESRCSTATRECGYLHRRISG